MSAKSDSDTLLRREAQHRDRWTSYGAHTGILEISERLSPSELQAFEIFQDYDDKFLEKISPDVSVARWGEGAVLFEGGSYLDLAFFLVEGGVEIFLQHHFDQSLIKNPIFDAERTVLGESPQQTGGEGETVLAAAVAKTLLANAVKDAPEITFLSVMDFDLPRGGSVHLGPGELFGEIGAMSGWPQSATARTTAESTLVQIRVPALRAMRRRSAALKERLDGIYRQRSLAQQLQATPLFRGCDESFLESLKERVELISCEPDEVITEEGQAADALYLVRSGFLKLSQRFEGGSLVVNYLSKGMTLGEVELLVEESEGWTTTATCVEYAELVKVPRQDFIDLIQRHPHVEKRLWESTVARLREAGFSRRNMSHSEFIQTALDHGLVQGNSILVIDLESCTRCDDCVGACAATHDGRPRFLREGEKYGNLQIASACYHCRDPVCLVGCPTGAIGRAGVGDVVAVNETICIGCGTCSRNCPYDAIVMHETGKTWPGDMVPEGLRGKDRLVASKCDLCHTSPAGPACVKNCPNGCAYRIGSLEEFERLLSKR